MALTARDKAVAAVLGVVELLENILECLDVTTLLRLQVVCRGWRDLVVCMIRTNALTRTKLFIEPVSVGVVLDGGLEFGGTDLYMRYKEPWLGQQGGQEPKVAMLNPWLLPHRVVRVDDRRMVLLRGSDLIASMHAEDTRTNMLLTQPPTNRVTWQIKLGKSTTECKKPLTEHSSGQELFIATRGSTKSDGAVQGLADLIKFVESKVLQHWGCLVDWKASHVHLGGTVVTRQQMRDELSGIVELTEQMWEVLESRPYVPRPRRSRLIILDQ